MMIRSFLPVGQGALYCEQFKLKSEHESINIIYDCGCLPDRKIAEAQIRNTFKQGETIHALFISHLDEDHVNGIPYLLRYCNVKRMFFPLITEQEAGYMKVYNLIKCNGNDSVAGAFLNNPYNWLEGVDEESRPTLYQIASAEAVNDRNEYNAETIPSGRDVGNIIFGDVSVKNQLRNEWLYIPYNFRQSERITKLQKALEDVFGKPMSNRDLHKIWETETDTERKKIKAAYSKVRGSFNTNSMTLYSGTQNRLYEQSMIAPRWCDCHMGCWAWKADGCLYAGDYDTSGKYKWHGLYDAYRLYWNNIGCIQVPHHGSKHNYNQELAKLDAYYIISAGRNSKYRHPHSMVIKDLLFNGHFPYIVTENKSSEVHIRVNF